MVQPSLSIVVPVYNSEESLARLIERLMPVLRSCCLKAEVILINDGSRDGSWDCIRHLAAAEPGIRAINLMRNYGQHNAVLCGIRAARYEWIVTIDDDLQHPPEEIPKLLESLRQGYDVVYGTPEHEVHGIWRDAASRVTKLALQSAMGASTARHVSAFRAFRTGLRKGFADFGGPFVSIDVLLTWATTRFTAV
ncbi:MAG TPA: glycosyltransferase family 2 protein, partial [Armatimonadota bacterium]